MRGRPCPKREVMTDEIFYTRIDEYIELKF